MNLGTWLADQIITEDVTNITTIVAIYPGRFQPMGKHHAQTYKWLKSKFKDAHVVTSDKVDLPKSPFSFNEKKKIINSYGIRNVVKVKSPYKAEELLKKYDPKTTAAVFMVGAKDAGRLKGKFFKDWNGKAEVGYKDGAYLLIAPHVSMKVPGYGEMSGTAIRAALGAKAITDKDRAQLFKHIFGHMKNYDLITKKLGVNESILDFIASGRVQEILLENSKTGTASLGDVDDGPQGWYQSQAHYKNSTTGVAKQLGMTIINYLSGDEELKFGASRYQGKTMSPSSFPAGVAGKKTSTNQDDLPSARAYSTWKSHVDGIAAQVGMELLDYLGADISKKIKEPNKVDKTSNTLDETISLPVEIGDTVLMGKFKNKKVVVKTISFNEKGDLLINGKSAMRMRIVKKQEPVSESLITELDADFDTPQWSQDFVDLFDEGGLFHDLFTDDDVENDTKSRLLDLEIDMSNAKTEKKIATAKGELIKGGIPKDRVDDVYRAQEGSKDAAAQEQMLRKVLEDPEKFKQLSPEGQQEVKANHEAAQITQENNNISIKDEYVKAGARVPGKVIADAGRATRNRVAREKEQDAANKAAKPEIPKSDKKQSDKDSGEKKSGKGVVKGPNGEVLDMTSDKKVKNPETGKDVKAVSAVGDKNHPAYKAAVDALTKDTDEGIREELVIIKKIITEGGAYGHMSHPFDDRGLTFGDFKNIINTALQGKLDLNSSATEKTDGQNLFITWNGELRAARNNGDIKRGGMNVSSFAAKWKGRGNIEKAFTYAFKDLSKAIGKISDKQRAKIFGDGNNWMNMEIMYPDSANVIVYDAPHLQFHGVLKYEKGVPVGTVKDGARILAGMIKQVDANLQKNFSIIGPHVLKVPAHQDFATKVPYFTSKLGKLMSAYNMKDSNTFAEYHQVWWEAYIDKNFNSLETRIKMGLVKRWAFFDKSFRLNSKTIEDETLLAKIIDFDKLKHKGTVQDTMKPFEVLFFELGVEVLKNVKNFLTASPDKAIQHIKNQVSKAISDVRKGGDIKKLNRMSQQLSKLTAIGGFEAVIPSEGLVFIYKGKTYKLTGAFGPINQIAGMMTF